MEAADSSAAPAGGGASHAGLHPDLPCPGPASGSGLRVHPSRPGHLQHLPGPTATAEPQPATVGFFRFSGHREEVGDTQTFLAVVPTFLISRLIHPHHQVTFAHDKGNICQCLGRFLVHLVTHRFLEL